MVLFLPFVTLAVAGMVVASPLELGMESKLGKRAIVYCDHNNLTQFIIASYADAHSLARNALDYINNSANIAADPLFITYFGNQNPPQPLTFFQRVINDDSTLLRLSCIDPLSKCNDSIRAYTDSGNIYYCPSFYNTVDIAYICSSYYAPSDTRGGVTLNGLMSVLSGITNDAQGCYAAAQLALSNPDAALENGDNYNCFSMAAYVQYQC